MFERHGKQTEIGLGSLREVPLDRARKLAAEERQKLAKGQVPRSQRRGASGETSFKACAERLIENPARRPGAARIHAQQWHDTLAEGRREALAHPRSIRSRQRTCSVCCNRCGRPSAPRRSACAPASSACSTPPRRAACARRPLANPGTLARSPRT